MLGKKEFFSSAGADKRDHINHIKILDFYS